MLDGAGSFRPVEFGELREPILGRQRDQVVVTWIRLGIADRLSLGQDAKLVPWCDTLGVCTVVVYLLCASCA